jgi:hypothetical protein
VHYAEKSRSDNGGTVALTRNKTPRGKTTASENARLIELLAAQNAQMMTLMGKLLEQNTEASKAQREWLSLFKPPTTTTKSTSPEDREALKANEALWTELDMEHLAKGMVAELGSFNSDGDEEF